MKGLLAWTLAKGDARRRQLTTTYFDTPDHKLREAGLSLRIREVEGRFVQTVKTRNGASLFDRCEWEAAIKDRRPCPDQMADTPIKAILGEDAVAGLVSLFETRIERTQLDVTCSGAVIELSLDHGEIVAGERREAVCEVELELKSGAVPALFELAKKLGREAVLRLSFESKSERGYRLAGRDTLTALESERAQITRETSAGDAFRRVVRSCLGQITGNAERLTRVRSPDALHQLRVGLRRLQAAFKVFQSLVRDAQFAALYGEARWLAASLNRARDLDVLLSAISPTNGDNSDDDLSLSALRHRLMQHQAQAYDDALAAISSNRFGQFLLDLAAWTETGDWTVQGHKTAVARRSQAVATLAKHRLNHLRKSAIEAGHSFAKLDENARHSLRIKVKKLRYAADFFVQAVSPAKSQPAMQFMERLRKLQDGLGTLNDIAVARDTAMLVVGEPGGAGAGFAAGRHIGLREATIPALVASTAEAFDAFRKAKRFW